MFFQEIEGLIDREYIEYLYEGRFSFNLFLDRVVPILHECIESPSLEATCDDADAFIEDETDYSYELEEMLERMGMRKYDGLKGIDKEFDCTYIEAVTVENTDCGIRYARFPVNVLATIRIRPEEDTH